MLRLVIKLMTAIVKPVCYKIIQQYNAKVSLRCWS